MASKGTIIEGTYEITDHGRKLGEEVQFSGRRMSDSKSVSIHVMGPEASAGARGQFSNAARILGRLDHENCLSAMGAGQLVDETLYLVTPMVEAGPLSRLVGEHLPDRELAEVGLQLTRGIEHLHTQGIVLGAFSPDGAVLGERDGRPLVRLIDFHNACVLGQERPSVRDLDPHWVAPETLEGQDPSEAADLFSAGRVLGALTSAGTSPEIRAIISSLVEADPSYRLLASEATYRFSALIDDAAAPFDLSWLPNPEVTGVSSGVHEPEPVLATSTEHLPIAASNEPSAVFEAPRSRRGLAIGLALAGCAAAAVVVASTRASTTETAEPSASAVAPVAAEPAAAVAAPDQPVPAPVLDAEEPALEGNPIVWLAQVNRTELGAVLPLRDRKRLLKELASLDRVNARVNARWNAMLDLWQANDSERPCATFASALAVLDSPPDGELEHDLLAKVVVPSPAPGSRAGVAPDDSCEGLATAFAKFKDSGAPATPTSKSKRRSRPRRAAPEPTPPAATPAAPPKEPVKKKKSESKGVATKLDEELRDL